MQKSEKDFKELILLRKEYNISQMKLANLSGFRASQVSSWELNKTIPTHEDIQVLHKTLSKIVREIECDIHDIRKKNIVNSQTKKRLPKVIQTKTEYEAGLVSSTKPTKFVKTLNQLYKSSQNNIKVTAPKTIALFSGCGGISLGFHSAGYNLVGHVEIESSANRIYKENFPKSRLLGTDISQITDKEVEEWKEELGDIDIVIGGPPCQGFSLMGKRDAHDARNQLYLQYARIISILQPKVFVMENVKLLTSMKTPQGAMFIDCIIDEFESKGFEITKKVINAYEFGVPQSRERVFLVGVNSSIDGINTKFKFPESEFTTPLTFREATQDLPQIESGELTDDPLHWAVTHPKHVINWLKDVPQGASAHQNDDENLRPPSGFNTTYKRIKWDEPCSTIATNFSMISGSRNVHPTSTRSFTIREATRTQTFPDQFVFVGKWGDIRKAIGNAVPPLLAYKLASAIKFEYF